MKDKIYDFLKNEKTINYFIIIVVATFCCIPLFSKYMNIAIDDGIQHICRLIGTTSSINEGQIFPVIISEFCNGFGYSWNIFYSPLTAYLPLIFKIFTSSNVICLKLFIYITMILSGVFMYKLLYKITKNNIASSTSAIIYITTPYHITDLYNRMAVAELTSFVFLPLVFLGLYELLNGNKKTYYLAFGAIGLILTHNVITIYTAVFSIIYLLINYKKLVDKKVIINILIIVILILLCTSFYWIPLLEHYFATTYEVFIPGRMYNDELIINTKLSIIELIFNRKWGINLYIGFPLILSTCILFLYIKKLDKTYKKDIITFLVFGIFSIVMILKIFPFEYLPNIFKMIQFVWRLLIFVSFFLSIISGISISMFIQKDNKKTLAFIIIFVICTIFVVNTSKQLQKEPFNEMDYLSPVPVDHNTLRVHAGCASFEYLPKKAYSNLDYIKTRDSGAIVLNGRANIKIKEKNGINMALDIESAEENARIELPYIYYLGYTAVLIDDNNVINLPIKESDNGFCMIEVPNIDKGTINIEYTGTTLMKASYVLTLAGIIGLIWYACKNRYNVI